MEKQAKCWECNGIAILKYRDIALENGKIKIPHSPYYECQICHEKFVTSPQMYQLDERIHSMIEAKKIKA